MATHKYKSNDTRARGGKREKTEPDSIFDWFVGRTCCTQKQGKRNSVSDTLSFHIPTGSIQRVSGGKGDTTRTDDITPLDFYNQPVSSTGFMCLCAPSLINHRNNASDRDYTGQAGEKRG